MSNLSCQNGIKTNDQIIIKSKLFQLIDCYINFSVLEE